MPESRAERIEAADDARVADYRDFRDPELRRRRGLFAVEGRESAGVLLEVGRFRVRSALLTPTALGAFDGGLPADTSLFVAEAPVVEKISGVRFHQGCVLLAERPPDTPLESLLEPEPRLLLALEDVTDPDNVGGAFRNAFAFGVDAVLLTRRAADPLYRKAIRTSLGATLRIPFTRCDDWALTLERVRSFGLTWIALTPSSDAVDVSELAASALPDRVALAVGNEGEGLSRALLAAADLRVRIPMAPGANSLNVATADAIALHLIRSARPESGARTR
jgi:tRNA G18 (ribose-2'-O)-methylase SpoU